ncbi:MAG: hypothetical protein ACI4QU_00315 [Christensenellales bacterium]
MEVSFEKQSFKKRLTSMLNVDFKRAFTMPPIYIMAGVCLFIPILIFVMTSAMSASGTESFTNVWQSIGTLGGTAMTMDLTGMCNINLVYFFVCIYLCIFVSDDFKSGYAKNLFAVRSKKIDYVFSKSLLGFVCGVIMFLSYFIGAIIGGAVSGLSFDTGALAAGNIAASIFAKAFLILVFVGISVLVAVIAKQKLWLSVLIALASGMLLFALIPVISPLNSTFLNVVICFIGGAAFAVGLGCISNIVLNKTNLT